MLATLRVIEQGLLDSMGLPKNLMDEIDSDEAVKESDHKIIN